MSSLWSEVKPAETPSKAANAPIEGATALKSRLHARLLEILNLALLDRTPRENLRPESPTGAEACARVRWAR